MTINSMIQFLAIPSGTLLLVVFVSWKYVIPKFLDTALEQRLKEKQHDLDKELEEHKERIKHELHKEHLRVAAKFNKINELYPKLFSELYKLKSRISSFQAQFKQNWVSLNDNEIRETLKEKNFGGDKIEHLVHRLRFHSDDAQANKELADTVFKKDIDRTLFDLHDKIHFIKSNSLFMSKETKTISLYLVDTLLDARSQFSLAYDDQVQGSTKHFMAAHELLSKSVKKLKELEAVMRLELNPYD